MKSTPITLALLGISVFSIVSFYPASASAAWWESFSVKKAPATPTPATNPNPNYGISGSAIKPTIGELQNRISELEGLLREANAKLAEKAQKVAKVPVVTSVATQVKTADPVSVAALSEKSLIAKVKPAVVYIETATSSGSGIFIDNQGRILTNAHTVWTQDASGVVIGVASNISVTLSNGSKKSAKIVGLDEWQDIAVIQLADKNSPAYVNMSYDSGLAKGDMLYTFSLPSKNGGAAGNGFVPGVITQKTANTVEINTDSKPFDTGGALVNAKGDFIAIPNKSSCKVIEEMTNCLKYRITGNLVKATIPKLMAGMRLYRQRTGETVEETTIRDALDSMYQTIHGDTIDFAVASVSGDNSFDYFNSRLGADKEGKIAKLYVLKLKQIAVNMAQVSDLLKSKSYDLNVFFINESANIAEMGGYQRTVLARLQADNALRVKEYQAKLDFWTKKKNEYDSLILKATSVTHDYLMAEGAVEELEAKYFTTEKNKLLSAFSGETVNIF